MITEGNTREIYDITGLTPLAGGYEFTFPYSSSQDVRVYTTGNRIDTEVPSSNYTIDKSGATPKVVFNAGYSFPAGQTRLTIIRNVSYSQELDLRNGDLIDADKLEGALDVITQQIQQVAEKVARAILASVSDTVPLSIPESTERSNMLLGFDNEGKVIPVLTTDIEQKLSEALRAEENVIGLESSTQSALQATEEARDLTFEYKSAAEEDRDKTYEFKQAAAQSESNAAESERSAAQSESYAMEYRNGAREYWTYVESAQIDIAQRHGDIASKHEEILSKASAVEENKRIVEADMAEAAKAVDKAWQHALTASTAASNVLIYTQKALASARLAEAILSQIRTSEENVNGMESRVSDLLVESRGIEERTSDMLASASGYAAEAKASESQAGSYRDASLSYMNTAAQHKDAALSYKQGADLILAQMARLRDEISAIVSQSVADTVMAIDGVTYRRSVYVKNGRPYATLVAQS